MAPSGRSCRTFTNRDPTGVGHRVPNRTFLPRCCPRSAHPQLARSRQALRSLSSDAERALVTSELSAAGRTNGGSKGTISSNVGEHRGRIAPASSRFFEGVDHVVGLGDPEDLGGDDRAGVVVDEVEDLDVGSVF